MDWPLFLGSASIEMKRTLLTMPILLPITACAVMCTTLAKTFTVKTATIYSDDNFKCYYDNPPNPTRTHIHACSCSKTDLDIHRQQFPCSVALRRKKVKKGEKHGWDFERMNVGNKGCKRCRESWGWNSSEPWPALKTAEMVKKNKFHLKW